LARGADLARDFDWCVECLADIHIDERLQKYVIAPVLVDEDGGVPACVQHVVNRRQFLEIERHGPGEVLGLCPRRSDAHRHQFAHMADFVGCERVLLRDFEAAQAGDRPDRLHTDEIGCGEGVAALIGGNGNAANAPMRDGAADESDVLHSGQPNIGDELPATAQEPIIFLSGDAGPDALWRRGCLCHRRNLLTTRASAFFLRR
jgi:hypothetical protein